MQREGCCRRIRLALSGKPVLPLFALFVAMGALGCCICGIFGNMWMKNTTNYTEAKCLWLGIDNTFDVLDATVHVNPHTMWLSFTYQVSFGGPSVDTSEQSLEFSDITFLPAAQSFAAVSDTTRWLIVASAIVTGSVCLGTFVLCVAVIAGRSCARCLKSALTFLSFGSAVLPVVSVAWWSMSVANPADLGAVVSVYQTSMTIDGDMGWSAVLPVLGGCGMLLSTLCLAVYLPPRPQTPLDAALNYDGGDAPPIYHPLSAQLASEDAGDGSVEGFSG